ncbi:MAG: sugar nucleotide-binding protein [Oceanospirillaceae bacterium]|nr:sugar nucleotide-binding protein [Oceanospirillaceae bacterium]
MLHWSSDRKIKILVTGPKEQVGMALLSAGEQSDIFEVLGATSNAPDLRDKQVVAKLLEQSNPDFVVNTLGYNSVVVSEKKVDLCYLLNRDFLAVLAEICSEKNIPIIHLSTDHVFDGHYASGYTEDDQTIPLGIFGKSKWQGEEMLRQKLEQHLILRVSWLFSPWGDNFLTRSLQTARTETDMYAADDRSGCPTSAGDIARVVLAIIRQLNENAGAWGTYHYCGAEVTTRFKFLEAIYDRAQHKEELVTKRLHSVPRSQLYANAERPASSVLNCKKLLNDFGIHQRPWRSELAQVIDNLYN